MFIERPLKMNMKHQPSPMQYKIIRGKTPKKKNQKQNLKNPKTKSCFV